MNLFNKLDDLVLGGVAGQELVNVRHQVDANGACKGIAILHIAQNEDDFVFLILSQLCCNTFGLEETDARMQVRRKRAIFMAKARLGVRVDLATFGDNTRHPFIFSCVGLLSMSHSIGLSVYIFYP